MKRRLAWAMTAVFAVALAAGLLGMGVRATYGGHAAVDEPQYLLTALSLAEDGDLNIADELADRRWRAFFDAELPVQTQPLADGRQLSPHDPLLPVLLAAPMGAGGFLAAKAFLALLAGATAALVLWVAVRRFAVPLGLATAGVAIAFASPPFAVYAQQVYPELPAALAVVVSVAALTGRLGRAGLTALTLAVVALPWLSVKYVPVAAMLALVGGGVLLRARRRAAAGVLAGVLAVAGLAYLGVHRAIWGGWTVYASGDHFVTTGEFSVVGVDPNYVGRGLRLVGLLADRGYGLAAWQPAWLLALPALAALLAARPRGWPAIALPLAAGWLMATFIALTMHGFWWPGRQVVIVLPLALLAVLWWPAHCLHRPAGRRIGRRVAPALGLAGVFAYACLLIDGWAREITWVTGFERVDNPIYQAIRTALPDYRSGGAGLWIRHIGWIVIFAALAAAGWRSARGPTGPAPDQLTPSSSPDLARQPTGSPHLAKGSP
jgi:hypothetical protein